MLLSNSHMTFGVASLSGFTLNYFLFFLTYICFSDSFTTCIITSISRAHMDRLPQSAALRQLTSSELIRFLFLIVSELNSRINAEADSISDSSSVPPPPPPAASRNHRQRAPRGQCGQDCKYCSSACSRATAGHGHHSCWTHRHCRD